MEGSQTGVKGAAAVPIPATATEKTMSSVASADSGLKWDVLTIKRRPGLSRDLPAGKEALMWVANSSTLISGERDAVLVDTFLTIEQSQTLLDWVVASGKNLTAIYITHGHGDHFFGLASLLERFPQARAVATPEVVKAMHKHLLPASIENFWRRLFPGQIADRLPAADPLDNNELKLTESTHIWVRPIRRADLNGLPRSTGSRSSTRAR
jgi:glyoxylase-like metal-dependent hydrolase (beta-lactamase superfamily II)